MAVIDVKYVIIDEYSIIDDFFFFFTYSGWLIFI